MKKQLLLATFIFKNKTERFINNLKEDFDVKKENIFKFNIENDNEKELITFKINIKDNEVIDIKNLFPNSVIINKRGNALYTINALNLLIKETKTKEEKFIKNKNIKIDWELYQNKIITSYKSNLSIININRVFL